MNKTLHIDDLLVLHQAKASDGRANWLSDCPSPDAPGFFLDTCMRKLAIPATSNLRDSIGAYAAGNQLELFSGPDAYRFLLEVATGLHSAIPAETNILGQIKSAWQNCATSMRRDDTARLQPVIQSLLNDSKLIRQEHLQGLGGNSYGSLARKLIKPNPNNRILFVGSGELTQSMLPFFRNLDVGVWNYRLPVDAPAWATQVFEPDQSSDAADWANAVVLTTPQDLTNDNRWIRLLHDYPMSAILHLGVRRELPGMWSNTHELLTLDDLFDLRSSQSDIRSIQIQQAQKACRNRAEERAAIPFGTHLLAESLA
ncbi:MAG: hypothetical protein P8R04_00605 [Gammaproteobacteria bacterium]|nr:hypothetical protein [Gammaproteobacteria bacterium]